MQEAIEPSNQFKAQANIKAEEHQALLESFKQDSNKTWLKLAKENLDWFQEPSEALEMTKAPFFTCFADGKLNISYNCIDRHLANHADKAAIIFEGEPGDSKTLTYQKLHDEVCRAANMFKDLGVSKGDRVTLYMPMCPEAIIAMQACMRIGAVHSVVFAGFSAQALRDRITGLDSHFIITADALFRRGKVVPLLETVKEAITGLDTVKQVICLDRIKQVDSNFDDSALQQSIPQLRTWDISSYESICEPEQMNAEDPSFVLFTSGSTGKPKGLQHSQAGYLLWTMLTSKWVFDLKPEDIYWCTADIGWITGHSYVTYGPLANGATIFITEAAPNYPDESRFWSLIEKYKVSIFYTAPTAIRAFMQWGLEHVKKHDLSSLRLLGSVGEPINPAAWHWFYEHIGYSNCPIVDTWWQTETGGIVITTLPGIHTMKPGSAGLALPGIKAGLHFTAEDTEHEAGLLYIQEPIPSMARTIYGNDERYIKTYWNLNVIARNKETKQSNARTVYLAGDAAIKDQDGYIMIEGRIDDVINVSGHRLGTAEIESALVAHEAVSEAAVVSIPHEIKGEGIVAYTVIANNCHPEDPERREGDVRISSSKNQGDPDALQAQDDIVEQLKEQVAQEIGSIAKPERIIICKALPKTRSGKIMRRLLKDIAQGKEPHGDVSTLEDKMVLEELSQASSKTFARS